MAKRWDARADDVFLPPRERISQSQRLAALAMKGELRGRGAERSKPLSAQTRVWGIG